MTLGSVPHDTNLGSSLRAWLERARQEISKPKRPIFIPVTQFSGLLNDASVGSGAPALGQINSLGLIGLRIDAVNDAIHHLFFIPKDFNVSTNVRIGVVWTTNSSDTSETATWEVEYNPITAGQTLAAASTAMDNVITADTVLGAYIIHESPYGTIFEGNLYHMDYLHLNISLSAVSGLNPAADEVFLLGILINDE